MKESLTMLNTQELIDTLLDEYNKNHSKTTGEFTSGGGSGIKDGGLELFDKMAVQWDKITFPTSFKKAAMDNKLIVKMDSDKVQGAMHIAEGMPNSQIAKRLMLTEDNLPLLIKSLETNPKDRGKGIGSELIAHACSKVKPEQMLLLVSDESAVNFYKKIGMKKVTGQWFMFDYNQAQAFAQTMAGKK